MISAAKERAVGRTSRPAMRAGAAIAFHESRVPRMRSCPFIADLLLRFYRVESFTECLHQGPCHGGWRDAPGGALSFQDSDLWVERSGPERTGRNVVSG